MSSIANVNANPATSSPASHRWQAGDLAIAKFGGHKVQLVRASPFGTTNARDRPWECQFIGGELDGYRCILCESAMEFVPPETAKPKGNPAVQPIPPTPAPSPTHFRAEYPAFDPDTGIPARKAALVPIADRYARWRLVEALSYLAGNGITEDDDTPDDEFILDLLGGEMADPYAVGDRVRVTDGPCAGHCYRLVQRDEGNDQRWWMAKDADSPCVVGLHVDSFELDERGDD